MKKLDLDNAQTNAEILYPAFEAYCKKKGYVIYPHKGDILLWYEFLKYAYGVVK